MMPAPVRQVQWALTGSPGRLAATLAGLGVLTAAAVWAAPAEQTLGDGIRWVYLHVALTWTGLTGLAAAAGLGLALLISGRPALEAWMRQAGGLGLGFFAAGWLMSAAASVVNWGGVAWGEPRNVANLQILAAGVIVLVAVSWPLAPRWKGLFYPLHAGATFWLLNVSPLILHPRNPIFTAESSAFAAAFLSVYALTTLAGLAILAFLRREPAGRPGAARS